MSLLEDVRSEEALCAEKKKAAAERMRVRFAEEQKRADGAAAERVTNARREAQERVAAASEKAAAHARAEQVAQQQQAAALAKAARGRLPDAVKRIIEGVESL